MSNYNVQIQHLMSILVEIMNMLGPNNFKLVSSHQTQY